MEWFGFWISAAAIVVWLAPIENNNSLAAAIMSHIGDEQVRVCPQGSESEGE